MTPHPGSEPGSPVTFRIYQNDKQVSLPLNQCDLELKIYLNIELCTITS